MIFFDVLLKIIAGLEVQRPPKMSSATGFFLVFPPAGPGEVCRDSKVECFPFPDNSIVYVQYSDGLRIWVALVHQVSMSQ